jgi:hypothetical protein
MFFFLLFFFFLSKFSILKATKITTKTGGKKMNNEVLDIYNNLTDAEAESLFSTPKDSRKGDRRKIDYKKAKRKARIDLARSYDGLPLYDNLHQYSKNKIHCSCRLCRGKDYFGRHITTEQEVKSHDEMLVELKELDENLLAEMRGEAA